MNDDPTEPINGVSGDEKFLNDKVNEGPTEPVNGVGDEPEDKQMKLLRDEKKGPSSPPVNGARDEERPRFDAASAGQGSVPEMTYDSAEIAVAHDVMNDPNGGKDPYHVLWILDKNSTLSVYEFNLENQLGRFLLNLRAVSAKIKLPKKNILMARSHFEYSHKKNVSILLLPG